MKKFIGLCAASGFLYCASLNAILPPLYEGIAEIKAILSSKELPDYLTSGDVILSIQKSEKGYAITTNKRKIEAEVVYSSMAHVGPAQFEIRFIGQKVEKD